ncbi:DUF397 domain-containing protein [Streptomyces chattanoogensis]|uniref:DUF397 domain-containing protein n=1 Tax=Streptomyces chattanoogensis TaxID=66876 RepID=UPI00367B3826
MSAVAIQWRKSSFSEQTDNCVELASYEGDVLVREGDDPSVVIKTTRTKLRAFVASVKAGKLDGIA